MHRSLAPLSGSLLGAALLLIACDLPTVPPNNTPDASTAATGCEVTVTYRPQSSATRVGIMGEWNQFDRLAHLLKDPDGDGTYSLVFRAPPGLWAYAFLENGLEVPDKETRFVRYREGRPGSAMRIPDCTRPSVTLQKETLSNTRPAPNAGELRATLSVSAGEGQRGDVTVEGTVRGGTDAASRALTAAELMVIGDGSAQVRLTGLADGKYTLSLTPSSGGRTGEVLLIPFWIEAEKFSYRDTPIYMLMTDRFRDGDASNNAPVDAATPFSTRFQGGDFQGVTQSIKEGYFDALGIKAIWLTPWQTQSPGTYPSADGRPVSAYHGYWPVKAREVDARFGGADALKEMVAEAHRHGIRIVMDAVLNHVHIDHEYFKDPAKKAWFRPDACVCEGSGFCSFDGSQRLVCLFAKYMPDINWTNNDAADQFVADTLWWMEEFDLDGLRLDAVKQMEPSAFTNLTNAVRDRFEQGGTQYYMFGESFTGDHGLIKSYMGPRGLDGQLNFPLFFDVPEAVFARDDQGLQRVKDGTQGNLASFGDAMMVNFVGNHDVPRFITKADPANRDKQGNKWEFLPGAPAGTLPYDRLHMAMVNLMTIPGVPLLYYGDEYGEFGGADPDNRHMLNREPTLFDAQRRQLGRMKALLTARAQLRGLRRGPLQDLWVNDAPWGQGKGNLYAYSRPDADPRHAAVVVINLTDNVWTNVVVHFPGTMAWTAGVVRDALSQREYGFGNSEVTVDVPARGAVLLHLK